MSHEEWEIAEMNRYLKPTKKSVGMLFDDHSKSKKEEDDL